MAVDSTPTTSQTSPPLTLDSSSTAGTAAAAAALNSVKLRRLLATQRRHRLQEEKAAKKRHGIRSYLPSKEQYQTTQGNFAKGNDGKIYASIDLNTSSSEWITYIPHPPTKQFAISRTSRQSNQQCTNDRVHSVAACFRNFHSPARLRSKPVGSWAQRQDHTHMTSPAILSHTALYPKSKKNKLMPLPKAAPPIDSRQWAALQPW